MNDDSLSLFLERNDLKSYFRRISELSDSAFSQSNVKSLLALNYLLQQDFGSLNIPRGKNYD
jgi:hypothetical protein